MSGDPQRPHRVIPPSRRRDKPVLSCSLCRRRKLKCDRQQPCQSCVQRGLSLSCTYVQHTSHGTTQGVKAPESVHDRIDQLEKLVTTLMNEKYTSSTRQQPISIDAISSEVPDTPDRVELDHDATSYTNSSHWLNILDGITELRDELDRIAIVSSYDGPGPDTSGPDLLFGRQRHATKNEILAAIPPKAEADQLIHSYFTSMDMASAVLHKPTFLKEYDRFWERPFETSVMWVALLFSVLALSAQFQAVHHNPDFLYGRENDSLYSARMCLYREKAAQSLVLADYSKCPRYTVEALLHYAITEYFRSQDAQCGLYMLISLVVRAAFRMGYHRDPSRFPNISPFEGEMRRRYWYMMLQLDLMTSSQIGLPRMVQPSVYDVAEPRNLLEEDLYEDMIELPPSKPDTEATVMVYTLARTHVLHVFSRIVDLTNSTTYPPYAEILRLDKELQHVVDNLPSSIKAIGIKAFDYSDSKSAMRGLFLGLSFLKAKLTLHRPFLLLGRTDRSFEYARVTCIKTALELLDCQQKLHLESRPGGRLATESWRLWTASWGFSSVVNHHFLLATTILSLDLDKELTSPAPGLSYDGENYGESNATSSMRTEILTALQNSYKILVEQCETSREARKVAAAVRLVLRKADVDVEDDNNIIPYDSQTPLSQSDFTVFTQGRQTLEVPGTNSAPLSVDNPHFVLPLLPNMNGLFMDIPDFDWVGMESDMGFNPGQPGIGGNYRS